jgi:hypothetical protein
VFRPAPRTLTVAALAAAPAAARVAVARVAPAPAAAPVVVAPALAASGGGRRTTVDGHRPPVSSSTGARTGAP